MTPLRRLAVYTVLLFIGIFFGLWLNAAAEIYSYAMKDYPLSPSEYAIVLGAKTDGDQPLPAFERRIAYGVELYHSGLVSKLIFTGKPGDPPQALVAKAWALRAGVPEKDILVETESLKTFQNLNRAKALIPNPNSARVLIVSDPLHLKRALLMAKDLGLQASPAPIPNPAASGFFSRAYLLFREGLALWKYRLLGGSP